MLVQPAKSGDLDVRREATWGILVQGECRMDPHRALLQKLQRYPELKHREVPGGIRVEAPNDRGFTVELRSAKGGWAVYLGEAGFHERFSSADDVMNFIAWCYSGQARIREVWRGNWPQRAILEAFRDGEWLEESLTEYFIVPVWLGRHEIIRTNPNLLKG
jgi:hypothetical protein